jgi:phage baseplate assembly protein W
MSEQEYLKAKAWLVEVSHILNGPGVIVMRPEYWSDLQRLIETTRADIARYEVERGLDVIP